MATFELSHQVATGKQQAKQLAKDLKALHQTLKDTNTDATTLQGLYLCVAKAQELSTESFLFIEKEAEKYASPALYIPSFSKQLIREYTQCSQSYHLHHQPYNLRNRITSSQTNPSISFQKQSRYLGSTLLL